MARRIWIGIVVGFICLAFPLSMRAEEAGTGPEPAQKKDNPVIDIPVGTLKFLYGGFQGFGSIFDGFITGDKPPGGSLEGKQDPMPVIEHDRQF